MKVKVGISARHVHLNKEDLRLLFGEDYELTFYKKLKQANDFSAEETVTLKTDKASIQNVRIIGPIRDYTQVEISKTDSYLLGVDPPIRNSGDLEDAAFITIVGPKGNVTKRCCIIATRHIHANEEALKLLQVKPNQLVKIKIDTIKGGILDNVYINYSPNYNLELHLDVDDANAHLLNNEDEVQIIK